MHIALVPLAQRAVIIFQSITIRTLARQLNNEQTKVKNLQAELDNVPRCDVRERFTISGGPTPHSFNANCDIHAGHRGSHELHDDHGTLLLVWPNDGQPPTPAQQAAGAV